MSSGEPAHQPAGAIGGSAEAARPTGWRLRRLTGIILLVVSLAGVGGFASFLRQVQSQTAPDIATVRADGVAVLTGGRARLEPAVALLRQVDGARLLVSGVNRNLSAETLRRTLGVDESLFACCVDIDRQAEDTIGNAEYTARWAREHGFETLVIVTNDYHMPRALLEMRRALPDVEIMPYPVVNRPASGRPGTADFDRYRVLGGEFGKYLVALARPN